MRAKGDPSYLYVLCDVGLQAKQRALRKKNQGQGQLALKWTKSLPARLDVEMAGDSKGAKNERYNVSSRKKDVRTTNIEAAKAVADAVRTSLGPRGMDKMVRFMLDLIEGAIIRARASRSCFSRALPHRLGCFF
jgi:hypothetical protein